jgi:hypothetical protein
MSRKLGATSLLVICLTPAPAPALALAGSPAFADVGIRQTGQAIEQGDNSNQSAVNVDAGAGGDNSVIGDAAPILGQTRPTSASTSTRSEPVAAR